MNSKLTSWRLVAVTVVVTCIGIAPTFWLLWPKWMDSYSYSHGLLVAPMSIWLLWRCRDRINAEPAQMTWWAAPILFLLLLAWIVAFAANIEIGAEASMPLIVLAALVLAAGTQIAKIAAFPVLLIYSAIPVWDHINGALQSLTTIAVAAILAIINVPAHIDGNTVQIPRGWFEIAGGCSGLHFFIVGMTLGAVYGYLYLNSVWRRIALVAVIVLMSVVMNWVRVATIITAGHLTNMQSYLVRVDHYSFGWVLFAVMLVPFFLVARRIEEKDVQIASPGPIAESRSRGVVGYSSIVAVYAMLLLPALVWGRLVQNEYDPLEFGLPAFEGLEGPREYTGIWSPRFGGADGEVIASYGFLDSEIVVYANWYKTQSQGRELIGSGNSVTGQGLQKIVERDYVDMAATNTAKLPEIREIIAGSTSGDSYIVWYYYVVGGVAEPRQLRAVLKQAVYAVFGSNGTGIVALSMRCKKSDCAASRHILLQNYAGIEKAIGNTLEELDDDQG